MFAISFFSLHSKDDDEANSSGAVNHSEDESGNENRQKSVVVVVGVCVFLGVFSVRGFLQEKGSTATRRGDMPQYDTL